MPPSDQICHDLRDWVVRLAGEAGQASLAASGDSPALRAAVDQHAAEIRDALARPRRPLARQALLSYARGFTEASIGRGWWPPHRRTHHSRDDEYPGPGPVPVPVPGPVPGLGVGLGVAFDEPEPDWESLRLAAVCRLLLEAEGLPV